MKKSRPLALERLEDRCTPANFGNPWPNAHHLTLSFAPDTTPIGPYANQLSQLLDTPFGGNRAAWQREILRAFQTWAVNADINVSTMADGGQPFGTSGPIQGDTRFGDIRVGAAKLSSLELAQEQPFDVDAGTWAGDLILNAKNSFGYQPASGYDLFSVALHEAGHVLGLDHSANPASPMYEYYGGVRTGLIAEDIARLQALYGARPADAYEGSTGNDTLATATPLPLFGGVLSLPKPADITTLGDKDFYSLTAAPLVTTTVRLTTHNVSLLEAKLTILDSSGRVVSSAVATDPTNGDLAISLPVSLLPKTYYIKVESGSSDVFGIGSYNLDARANLVSFSVDVLQHTLALAYDAAHDLTNNTLDGALGLGQLFTKTDSRFDYTQEASVGYKGDVDYWALKSPTAPAGTTNEMTVLVWGEKVGQLNPRAAVFDAYGNPVAARILVNEGGNYSLQVDNAASNAVYYVSVQADNPSGPNNTGDYFLGVDFGTRAERLNKLLTNEPTSDTLAGAITRSAQPGMTLTSEQDNLFHFVLSAESTGVPAGTAIQMTVSDASGKTVATLTVTAGTTRSLTLFLGWNKYTVRFSGVSPTGQAVAVPLFNLFGDSLSDPVQPYQYDPTSAPSGTSGGSTSSSSGSGTTASNTDYGTYDTSVW
jgi:Matrixin